MTKKRILIDFQKHEFNIQLDNENAKCDQLNFVLETIRTITDNEIQTIDVNMVNEWLKAKSGFKNAEMSAKLLDIENEYNLILKNVIASDDYIDFKEGKYKVNEGLLRKKFELYFSDDEQIIFEKLQKVSEILTSIDFEYFKVFNRLGEIDKIRVHHVFNHLNNI